jgi:hypothetical protein
VTERDELKRADRLSSMEGAEEIGSMHVDSEICSMVNGKLEIAIRWAGGSRSDCSNLTGVIEFSNGVEFR